MDRICPHCKEPIKEKARRCPHCTTYLSFWTSPVVQTVASILAMFCFFSIFAWDIVIKEKRYSEYDKKGIEIIGAEITHYKDAKYGPCVCTLGRIKNNTDLKWARVKFEVQYFNKEGKLIDTLSDQNYNFILLPRQEQAFRVTGPAVRPPSEYASQKIFIREASEAGRFD